VDQEEQIEFIVAQVEDVFVKIPKLTYFFGKFGFGKLYVRSVYSQIVI